MKSKIYFILIFSIALSMVLFISCKRTSIEAPSPVGPSSFSILLDLSASPNILFAGSSRESSTITAHLTDYKGTPIANKTVLFEISPSYGFFEGNKTVTSTVTDQNGSTSIIFFGPNDDELSSNTTVYIYARVAWEGKEFIAELTPIYIVGDAQSISLTLSPQPNVLYAGATRERSTIKATLTLTGGIPYTHQKIYFEICDSSGNNVELGYFNDNISIQTRLTDENGTAEVTYFGPTLYEISSDTTIYIKATHKGSGDKFTSTTAPIQILREPTTISLDLSASPNVIRAGTTREKSTVTAALKLTGGTPFINQKIYFEICNSSGENINIGYLHNNTKYTDENGIAEVTYSGPYSSEITTATTIYIKATYQGGGGDTFLSKTVPIQILRDADS